MQERYEMGPHKRSWRLLLGTALAAATLLAGCGSAAVGPGSTGGAASTPTATTGTAAASSAPCAQQSGPTVLFADNQFQTLYIDDAIAQYIIENGYCQPAKSVTVSTAVAEQEVPAGKLDVWMEMWQQNFITVYNKAVQAGELVNLGPTYGSSTQGFYVPTYVIKGDPARGIKATAPGLTSVAQLTQQKYWSVFQDPHNKNKFNFVNCISSWDCSQVNDVMLQAFGLTKNVNNIMPGSGAALAADIAGAYKKGQPILAYYWAPTWLLGQYNMTQLKQPAYTSACGTLQQQLIKNDQIAKATTAAGCGYENLPIDKGVWSGFAKQDPTVVAFLKKMDIHDKPLEATAAYMQSNSATAQQAALYFFGHYSEWQSWLPANVATRVTNALKAQGVTVA